MLSFTGFLVSILIARWGSPTQYGAYSTVQSFHLLGTGVHNALAAEPLGVLAPRAPKDQLRPHLIAAAIYSAVIAVLCGTGVAILTQVFVHAPALTAVVAVASPLLMFQLFARRICYAVDDQRAAMIGTLTFMAAALLGIYLFHTHVAITGTSAYTALGCGAIAATAVSIWMVAGSRSWLKRDMGATHDGSSVHRDYLRFASWLGLSCVAGWLNAGVYVPMVSKYLGLVQAGTMRAAELVFAPMDQFITSVGIMLVPLISAHQVHGRAEGPPQASPFSQLQLWACGGTVVYALIMFFKSDFILHLYYGGSSFSAASVAVPGIGISSIANGVYSMGPGLKLRVSGNTRGVFLAGLAGGAITLAAGIPLMIRYGIAGASGGRALAALGNLALAAWISRDRK